MMNPSRIAFGYSLGDVEGVAIAAKRLEDLGFDYVGAGDHVSHHGPKPSTIVSLGVAAGATSRIRLLSAILLLPLYPAALAAKLAAALDVASNGRFTMGVGVGGESPMEFEACGVPLAERGARVDEALALMRRLWTEENVSFAGRFWTVNELAIDPRPLQPNGPPIWISGRREPAIRRAARFGDAWLPYLYSPEQLAKSIEKIRALCPAFGRSPDSVHPAVFLFACCHRSRDEARRLASMRLAGNYGQDFTEMLDKYTVVGTPEDCRRRLHEYVDAGARTIHFGQACTQEYSAENQRLLAAEVMPEFRNTPAR